MNDAQRLLHLKMRPDTPQQYEYILLEDIEGSARTMLELADFTLKDVAVTAEGQQEAPKGLSKTWCWMG